MKSIKITNAEGVSLLCVAFVFQAFNDVITINVREVGTAAWISQLIGCVAALGVLCLYLILFKRYEGKDFLDIIELTFGKLMGKLLTICLLLYFMFLTSITLHEIVMLLRSFAYAEVEPLFLCMALMGVSCIVCRHPVKGLAMTASLFLPFILLLIIGVIALCSPQFNLHYLTPILGYGPAKIGFQGFNLISNYENMLMLFLFLPAFGSAKRFGKSATIAILVTGVCFLGVNIAYNLIFPYTAIFQNSSAMLNMTQSVYINRFLQRFESAFVAGVTSSVILVLCIGLLSVNVIYCRLFQIRSENQNAVIYPLAVGIILITEILTALNAHENSYRNFAHRYSSLIMVGLVMVLLLLSRIRKIISKKNRGLRAAALLLTPCLLATLFSGCGGFHEPDEEIYPLIMGYDKGETEKYRITFRFMLGKEAEGTPDANNVLRTDANGNPPPEIFVVEAPSALVALDHISSLVPKRYSLMHINMMIVAEDVAREGLEELVSPIIRHKETKNTMAFLITRGSAQETILAPTGKLDSSLPMFIESILEGRNGISNYDTVTIKDVYAMFEEGYGDSVAMYAGYQGQEEDMSGGMKLDPEGYLLSENPFPELSNNENADNSYGEGSQVSEIPQNETPTTSIDPDSSTWENGGNDETDAKGEELASPAEKSPLPGDEGDEEGLPPALQPAAEHLEAELSKSISQGHLPGELPVKSSAKLEIAGMAVLRDTKMVGYMDTRENAVHMMLKGNFYNGYYDVPDPENPDAIVVYRIHSRQATKADINIDENGIAHIDLDVFLKGRITVSQNISVRYSDPGPRQELERYTASIIENEAEELIKKLQKEFEADTLQLGKHIAGQFLTIPQWEEYGWHEHYPNAQINVKIDLKL